MSQFTLPDRMEEGFTLSNRDAEENVVFSLEESISFFDVSNDDATVVFLFALIAISKQVIPTKQKIIKKIAINKFCNIFPMQFKIQ